MSSQPRRVLVTGHTGYIGSVMTPMLVDRAWVNSRIPAIAANAHKGKRRRIVIIGGSGTGKSGLMRSIIGLQTPDAGEIEVFGQSIPTLTADQVAAGVTAARERGGNAFEQPHRPQVHILLKVAPDRQHNF